MNDYCGIMNAYTKIEQLRLPFQRSSIDVLKYWHDRKQTDPELYLLASIVFGVPPTQVRISKYIKLKYLFTIHTYINVILNRIIYLLNCFVFFYNIIQQVTIERAFSALRNILTESRNRLSEENLENILLAKLNPELLDRAIQE